MVVALLLPPLTAAAAFDELSRTAQTSVIDRCLPVRYAAGIDAWRACVASESQKRLTTSAATTSLELDEQFALQRFCASSPEPECTTRTLDQLSRMPALALEDLRTDERHALSRACSATQATDGPVAWRTCMENQAQALRSGGQVELDTLSLPDKNRVLNACRTTSDAAIYRDCLAQAGAPELASTTSAVILPSDPQTIRKPETTQAPSPSVAAALPSDVRLPTVESSAPKPPAQAVDNEELTESAEVETPITRLLDSVRDLTPTERAALVAAGTLPFIALIGVYFSRRLAREPEVSSNERLVDRVRTDEPAHFDDYDRVPRAAPAGHKARGPDTVAIQQRFTDEADDLFDALDATIASDIQEYTPDEFAKRVVDDTGLDEDFHWEESEFHDVAVDSSEHYSREPAPEEIPTRLVAPPTAIPETPMASFDTGSEHGPDFIDWLGSQPESLRQQHVIEFLVYWLAYGDDRYDPELKQTILEDQEPDSHSLIKAWVFRQDARALTEALRWALHNSSREQRVQIIELLVALLVTDAKPTPVQNTFLRFLADVFGLGEQRLQQLWINAFDDELPPLARVDRMDWWQAQDQDSLRDRDARAVSVLPEAMQFRARLGLPLATPITAPQLEKAWQLASTRCQPSRFDALGSRERQLVERQFQRFEDAHDGLLDHIEPATD